MKILFLNHKSWIITKVLNSNYRDGNIRYFEYANDDFIFLSEYKSADAQRGVAFLPKRGLAVRIPTLFPGV